VVEDTRTSAIVSSLCLISQTWSYDGIPFKVGRVEAVGTHPDYRRNGLIRTQFEVVHEWSAARGEMAQAITGIPWYYRQFGYEMAMMLVGGRVGYQPHVPQLKEGECEPYRVRPATESDLPFITAVYGRLAERQPIFCLRDETQWRYELRGRSARNMNERHLRVIETAEGEPVGFLGHVGLLIDARMWLASYELKPGIPWLAVTPSVMRYLWAVGEEYAARDGQKCETFGFALGVEHPTYALFADQLPQVRKPYAWYIRVPDLVGFVRHVAPALERRLAGSDAAGYTGALKISFYRTGLQLAFEQGRLAEAAAWPPAPEGGAAAFPDLTFLQLLFGYRSVDELDHAFADYWVSNSETRAVLNALFPQRHSDVWPIG
jgi:hypothetical protein